jgi:NDP-hexose-3-ketoreductase
MTASSAPPRALRLGVLGCADVAWRRTLPSLARVPGLELTAISSRSRDKAIKFAARFGGEPIEGFAALLERDDLDAVYLPLPTSLHAHWARAALRAGKAVLVEKPLAETAAQAAELVALAEQSGLVVMENFAFLHHTMHHEVRTLLESGAIGDLRALVSEFAFPPLPPVDIRYRPELGGGALLDAGVYPLRVARHFLGDDLEVGGAVLNVDTTTGVDVGGSVLLFSPDGLTAQATFGFQHAYRCTYVLWGSTGRIVVDRAYTAPDTFAPTVHLEQGSERRALVLEADAQFTNILAAFAAAICGESAADRVARGRSIVSQADLLERVSMTARRVQA